jgi:branched-chain amino acid aminotransferase
MISAMGDAFLDERFEPNDRDILGNLYEHWIYLNGEWVKGEDARVSVFDRGLLYGDGLFESIMAYDGGIFWLDRHIERLYDGAHTLRIDTPLTKEELKKAVVETVRKNKLTTCQIRIILTRGLIHPVPYLRPRNSRRPTVVIIAHPLPPYLGSKPIKMITTSTRKRPATDIDPHVKCLNYLNNILARLESDAAGADEALMLDTAGFVCEGTSCNIFLIKGKMLSTPRTTACLPGVTRATVMEIAKELDYEIVEKDMTLHEFYTADEAFVTGSGIEIIPVRELDGRTIGATAPPGPVTTKFQEAYRTWLRTRHVTPVYE